MEENLIDRIGDEYLNPNFQDGQILLNTDINEIVSIVKEGINANFNDIQKIQNGSLQVGNSSQLDGATLTKFSDGELEGADNKIPTSQLVKSYVDNKVQEIKDTTEVGQLVENINQLSIKVDNKVDKEDLVSEETAGTDKAYNCDYINELFESGVGDSLPIGTIVEYDGNNIPDGFEEVVEPENATVYVGSTEPTDGQDVWIQKGKNLFNKNCANKIDGYFNDGNQKIEYGAGLMTIYIPCEPNTTYTVQKIVSSRFCVGYTTEIPAINSPIRGVITRNGATTITITTDSDANYLCAFVYHGTHDSSLETILDSIQIEQGSATPYEKYVGKNIYVKNDNDDYEEFTDTVSSGTSPNGAKVWLEKGKNLFNKSKVTYSSWLTQENGEIYTANEGDIVTSFIDVIPNKKYTISGLIAEQWLAVCGYDANKNFVAMIQSSTGSSGIAWTFEIPSNVVYIRCAFSRFDTSTTVIQIEEGPTATSYEPFIRKIHTKNDNNIYEEFYNAEPFIKSLSLGSFTTGTGYTPINLNSSNAAIVGFKYTRGGQEGPLKIEKVTDNAGNWFIRTLVEGAAKSCVLNNVFVYYIN